MSEPSDEKPVEDMTPEELDIAGSSFVSRIKAIQRQIDEGSRKY